MFDTDPNEWTDEEIAACRDRLSTMRYRGGHPYIPRTEFELLSRRERWREMFWGRTPRELPYDRAVRARRARERAG